MMNQKRDNTTPSCAVCQRRKVKCDRVYPCAACTKSGLECVFNEVRDRKRPRKTVSHSSDHTTHDVGPKPSPSSAPRPHVGGSDPDSMSRRVIDPPSPSSDRGRATASGPRLIEGRYVNNHLYRDIVVGVQAGSGSPGVTPSDFGKSSPAGDPPESTVNGDGPSGNDDGVTKKAFVFGTPPSEGQHEAHFLQLPANHIVFLWQTYLNNVDPIMKVSHAPSVQQIVLGQIGKATVPKNEEALIGAVYFVSTVSLRTEECQESLQASRAFLLQRFREATETAMSAAGFVTSTDTIVLEGLVLYLAGLRSIGEVQYAWSLMGLAIRIAGAIGLSRDGSSFDLAPFEVEMRRRLWWSLVYLDCRMSEVVGHDGDLLGSHFDSHLPLNLNDADLFAAMKRLPNSRSTATECAYTHSRTLCLVALRDLQNGSGVVGTWPRLQGGSISQAEKHAIMETVERRFYDDIIRTCDPTVPLQYMAINGVKTFTAKCRLVARVPIVNLDKEWESSDGYSDNAFLLSMEVVQHQLELWCEPGVQQWKWHWQALFQWYALTCLLRQTRLRHPGPDTSKAWSLITRVFDIIIPTLELGPKKNVLFHSMNALLSIAKTSRNTQHDTPVDEPSGESARTQTSTPQDMSTISPYRSAVPSLSTGYGSAPHSALLPGMSTSVLTPASDHADHGIPSTNNDYPMLGLDLDAIDWVEFDRLAAELMQ